METIVIETLPMRFAVCKVRQYSSAILNQPFCFTGCTDEEHSLICPEEIVPEETAEADHGWRGFRIAGNLDFSLIGILSGIASVLADNRISILAAGTFNTDYIFVREQVFTEALRLLSEHGYMIKQHES